jgi:hypothetical protein
VLLTRDPRFLGTLRDARLPFVAADNPHATELTVDILTAVAADEARRTAERAVGRDRVHQQRQGRFLVWALAHADTVRRLRAGPYAGETPLLRAVEAADVPMPSGRYEWHPTTVARALTRLCGATAMPRR